MIQEPRIIPECYGNTLWTRFVFGKTVLHAYGSGVAKAMQKFPNRLSIGIIDDDKIKPVYFRDL